MNEHDAILFTPHVPCYQLFIAIRVLDIEVCIFIFGCDDFEFGFWVLIEI